MTGCVSGSEDGEEVVGLQFAVYFDAVLRQGADILNARRVNLCRRMSRTVEAR